MTFYNNENKYISKPVTQTMDLHSFFNISTEIRPMHTVSSINKSVTLFHDLMLLLSRIEKKNQEILPCFILLIIRFLIMIELVSNRV